jgi:hypothetical protein
MLLLLLAGVNSEAAYESKPSSEKDELALLWGLASLAGAVNHTLVAEDVDATAARTAALIERFEITDSLMQQEFARMRRDFDQTKAGIIASIEKSRERIREEIDDFKGRVVAHCMSAVETTKEMHFSYLNNSFRIVKMFFLTAVTVEKNIRLLPGHCQKVGILLYRKFEKQIPLFLSWCGESLHTMLKWESYFAARTLAHIVISDVNKLIQFGPGRNVCVSTNVFPGESRLGAVICRIGHMSVARLTTPVHIT